MLSIYINIYQYILIGHLIRPVEQLILIKLMIQTH